MFFLVMRFHYGLPDGTDFETLVAEFPDSEFPNLTRSTVPMLAWWKSFDSRIEYLSEELDASKLAEATACFEYTVKPPKGRGTASHTDLMLTTNETVVGVEAKHTEGMYPPIGTWLEKGTSRDNREKVLEGWLGLIENRTGATCDRIAANNVVYQMLHRLASVCSIDADAHHVVYQLFGDKHADAYKSELETLAHVCAVKDRVGVWLLTIPMRPSTANRKLETRLVTVDNDDAPELIRATLIDSDLFEFDRPSIMRVA